MKDYTIIGAGPGLGETLARRFGTNGHRVCLTAFNRVTLGEQVARLRELGIDARYSVADVSDADKPAETL